MSYEKITCPLNKAHRVLDRRMPYHLIKCKKKYRDEDLETCPFNAKHVFLKPGLRSHLETCPDKADFEAKMAYDNQKKPSGFLGLPVYEDKVIRCEENWDDQILPATQAREDKQFPTRQDPGFVSRCTTNSETEKIPQEEGQRTSTKSKLKKSIQSLSAVFASGLSMVGTRRGCPGYAKEDEGSEDSLEDCHKQLKKIEKKLRQIQLLEDKEQEGHTLNTEEVAKVGMKAKLTQQKENLQEKMYSD
uniref:Gametocyte-specific factor 1-like n=1 Tax=Crassostrea virginica TaxID=6565 RepID=A0A8B8EZK5_CRAVI|nr:gametocyte-specific factor 1-like [Crassostrea virginica]